MEDEDLLSGESERLEYKQRFDNRADKSRFLRTVVAFANGAGGRIVLGVEDGTGQVKGVPVDTDVADLMDAMTNSVSDNCTPVIPMKLQVAELQGKTVIVTEIFSGSRPPYFVRALGKEDGVFVRVGATTRPADPEVCRELEFRGQRRSWDSTRPAACRVLSKERIDGFCEMLYRAAQSNANRLGLPTKDRKPGLPQLLKWHLVEEADGGIWPTYGFEILEGSCRAVMGAMVRCGLFMGTNRVQIGDTKVYDGSIIEQFESALEWILSKLEVRWVVHGAHRFDVPELPEAAIRELLMNAICHRSWYVGDEPVTVAFFRDRLEITSPGGRPNMLSMSELLSGYTSLRNPAIANALAYCHMMELWGSGIPRATEAMRQWHLKAPEVIDLGRALRIVLYRPDANWKAEALVGASSVEEGIVTETVTKCGDTLADALSADEVRVLSMLRQTPSLTTYELARTLSDSDRPLSARQIRYLEDKLKAKGRLIRKGRGGGHWIIPD